MSPSSFVSEGGDMNTKLTADPIGFLLQERRAAEASQPSVAHCLGMGAPRFLGHGPVSAPKLR